MLLMPKVKKLIGSFFYPLVLLLVVTVLAYQNYTPGTYLTGWDNIHPEFAFKENIVRNLFGVWQEYQGLGLAAGNAHAADLPHQLFLWLSSLVLPGSFLRYFYQFLLLFLGPLGMYVWLASFLRRSEAFLGGLFYLLNLGTVQTFYAPFEPFTTLYGLLPWAVLVLVRFWEKPSRGSWARLVLVQLLLLPAFEVPTVFLVYLLVVMALGGEAYLRWGRAVRGRLLKVGGGLLLVNAFWLLPFAYFLVTNLGVRFASLSNTLGTEMASLQSKSFGAFQDVALLKGFWFGNTDMNAARGFELMMGEWVGHLDRPGVALAGYGLFGLVLLGSMVAWRKKVSHRQAMTAIFALSVFMLLNENPPLGFIFRGLRQVIPIFGEVFRFPYTKFSLTAILAYSFFLAVGVSQLRTRWEKLKIRVLRVGKVRSIGSGLLSVFIVGLMVVLVRPAFKGELIYRRMRVAIPEEYFELFDYLQTQDRTLRLADFPQHTFWGWYFYDWGYRGSGFLWYGIKQPILSRTFDMWSRHNEAYYHEVTYALYSENPDLLAAVLDKYAVDLVLVDDNVLAVGDQRVLFTAKLAKLLEKSGRSQLLRQFGNLALYSFERQNPSLESLLVISAPARVAESYRFTHQDQAYLDQGTYVSSSAFDPEVVYPFRTFVSGAATERTSPPTPFGRFLWPEAAGVGISLGTESVTVTADLPAGNLDRLVVPNYLTAENQVLTDLYLRRAGSDLVIKFVINPPELRLDGQPIDQEEISLERRLGIPTSGGGVILSFNQETFIPVDDVGDEEAWVGRVLLSTWRDNQIDVFAASPERRVDLAQSFEQAILEDCAGFPRAEGEVDKEVTDEGAVGVAARWANACTSVGLPLPLDGSKKLYRVGFDYLSATDERPFYCLKEVGEGCVSRPQFPGFGYAESWREFTDFSVFGGGSDDRLRLELWSGAYDSPEVRKIWYRNTVVDCYPWLGEVAVTNYDWTAFAGEAKEVKLPAGASPRRIEVTWPKIDLSPEVVTSRDFFLSSHNCNNFFGDDYGKELGVDASGREFIRYRATNASSCDNFDFGWLPQESGYLLAVESLPAAGLALKLCLANPASSRCDHYELLPPGLDLTVIPPMNRLWEGYRVQLDNQSIGRSPTVNDLYRLSLHHFPYDWIKSVFLLGGESTGGEATASVGFTGQRHSQFRYSANVGGGVGEGINFLVLEQATDPGWLAWDLDDKQFLTNRVVVDNWANGWQLPPGKHRLAIFYWPQLLEFLGLVGVVWALGSTLRWRSSGIPKSQD